ncbi:type II secretion system protein [Candidatus Saccharibacteria bacterium]|nr:type II secretion system protein [Candidatus Saccharibacteria bacterium]
MVELLIVIVVIAILAAVSFVAYSGLQARTRDLVRDGNIAQILNSAQIYAAEGGGFPRSSGYSCGLANSSLAINTIYSRIYFTILAPQTDSVTQPIVVKSMYIKRSRA